MSISLGQPCDEGLVLSKGATAPCTESSARWILVATILGSSMAFIDGTVVNVALAKLQANLDATVLQVQWVMEAYSLLLAAFLLLGGSLGDRYGRRRLFLLGVAVFALASLWCGLAQNIAQLIAARALQGLGGALLVPGSLAIIGGSFGEESRGRAIGTWSAFTAITTAIGPVVGGWLIEQVSWRAVFFINLPLAIIVVVICYWRVPESSSNEKGRLDWLGAIVIALGLGALVWGLIESARLGLAHPAIVTALVAGLILIVTFVFLERQSRHPLVPLELFRSRTFTGANLLTLLLYSALGGTLFFVPLNLIQVQHYSPTDAGGALLPFILIVFLLSRWAGGLVQKYGPKIPLIVGPAIAAIGFALFILPGVGGSYWKTFFLPMIVLGTGMAISVAPLTTTVMNSVAETRAGVASGINNAVSRVAGLLAIAVLGIVMLWEFNHTLDMKLSDSPSSIRQSLDQQRAKLAAADLPQNIPPAVRAELRDAIDYSFVAGFRAVMFAGALLAAGGALCAWWLIKAKAK